MTRNNKLKKNGFSLLELLLALGILGIIAVFALSISHSSKNLVKTTETKSRMKEVKRAVLDYYRGHQDLPDPAATNEVPVAATALNLEQKHRLDAWGRDFHYDLSLLAVDPPRTDIAGITVDGKAVAGVLISGGPDQTLEATNAGSPYATAGDDLVLPISVNEQAFAIAMADLEVLQSKVQAFDKMFAGIDNDSALDSDDFVDENGCVPAIGCPQTGTSNDPSCGTATLDAPPPYLFCSINAATPAGLIAGFYELGDRILLDPWLNEYAWGDPSVCSDTDLCYHKFFSYGPDGILGGGDDIIP